MSETNNLKKQGDEELMQQSLTDLMNELKSIVDWFNAGDVDVEVASVKFDRGAKLAEAIKRKLSTTENKVNEIKLKLQD